MDLVVLTDRRAEAEPDYCKIRGSCAERNVPLLDLFGLDQITLHRELQEQSYLTIPEWKELLSRYDAVSFPVPGAVVKYNKLQECWVARRRFLILYRWLLEQGKPVLFFREKEELAGALEAEGIEVRGRLMERSGNDRGYLRLAEQYRGKRILHIGTDPVADGIIPREYGMDSRMIRGFHSSYSLSGTGGNGWSGADREQLLEEIRRHDIISFDIFDTLIKRAVLYPKDVFEIVEARTGIRGFADCRYRIQTTRPRLSLDGFYRCLKEQCG